MIYPPDQHARGKLEWWAYLAFIAVCWFAAVSPESLWIDEALTAVKARQPDLDGWWRVMVEQKHSDLQMPLYMFWVWGWEKVFGSSEWALRAANLPWMLAGAILLLNTVTGTGIQRRMLVLALAFNPFAWYYLNEARPYAMQLGAAFAVLAGLRALHQLDRSGASGATAFREGFSSEKSGLVILIVGLVVLSGSSMLGMIWAGAAMLALVVLLGFKGVLGLCRREIFVVLGGGVLLAVLGSYYWWTLKAGARASASAGTNLQTIAFVIYELMGFGGIGPGRLAIRSQGLASFGPHLAALCCYALILIGACRGVQLHLTGRLTVSRLVGLVGCLGLPVIALLGAGLVLHFRVLGRHFTPLEGVWLLALSGGLSMLWQGRRRLNRALVVGFLFFSMVSCVLLRWAPWHARDDYRGAATVAMEAVSRGELVWWVAALEGGQYYGLPLGATNAAGGAVVWLMNPEESSLKELAAPDAVVFSRPDVYDRQGAVGRYLAGRGFEITENLPAFEIWEQKK